MDKEDKQIIKRAVKENWRIGDRTRLKHLLEKNLEQYRENKTLEGCLLAEQEHTLMLENENRLLGERCNQLLKDKGKLTDKIADIKANCDLAIEGRDVKIKELELELTVEKDQHQEEINLHLHAEDYIKELERLNSNQAESLRVTMLEEEKKDKRIEELEQQIEKMKCCGNCKCVCNSDNTAYFCKNNNYKLWKIKEND